MTLRLTVRSDTHHRFTVSEYSQMAEAGILTEDDRVEFLDGEIFDMTPIGPIHAADVDRLNHLFATIVLDSAQIRVRNPLRLDGHSEPSQT